MGLVALQAYWISNALELRENRFNLEVYGALQNISQRLEALETKHMFEEQQSFYEALEKERKAAGYSSSNTSAPPSNTYTRSQAPSGVVQITTDPQSGGRVIQERLMQKMSAMDSMFNQMMFQRMKAIQPLAERFSPVEIDSIISEELKMRGIKAHFEYMVLEDGHETPLQSAAFTMDDSVFKIPVFSSDMLSSAKWLLINFPGKEGYLFKSLWSLMALALFFTAVIIFAFYRTLNLMLAQKQISQIKTDFINNMTHEFKTPLATINLAVDALNNPKVSANEEKRKHYSKIIQQENRRMHDQVEKVLKMAMLDKNELELKKEVVVFDELLENSIDHMRLPVDDRGGTMTCSLTAGDLKVEVDPVHIKNVVVNILENALKYSPDTPRIHVSSRVVDHSVQVRIIDQGQGMSKEVQKSIFDRFYREERGNIHNVKGHGLGLSYALEMVSAHGGEISVESEINQGSTFTVTLPYTDIHNSHQ
ncbi:MAG: HAMP domain-containing sensor histidine kinase [Schleiferiaceae bacterium]